MPLHPVMSNTAITVALGLATDMLPPFADIAFRAPMSTRSPADDRVVVITLTEAGRALQEKAKDVPERVAGCIDLTPEKAQTLYALLYELLDNQKNEQMNTGKEQSK